MATTAPPSYDAALSELEQLEKNPLSDTEKAKVQTEVTSKITDATSTSELMDEIKQLSANTIKIDEDMHKVETALTQVDNAGFNFPRKLAPEWKVIRAEWNTLLWDSRETASKTAMRMQVWREVVLKRVIDLMNDTDGDPIDNMAEAVQLLKDFGNKPSPVKEVVENGASHSQGFINLQRKMNDFKNTFDGFTKAEQARIEGQIASVRQQINSLNAEIQQCDQMVARLSRALGFTIFGTIVGAGLSLFAFGIFGPCIAIKVLIVGAIIAINQKRQLIEYSRRAEALRGQLGAKQAELRGLEDKLALLKKCEAQLAAQKVAIGDIASRVGQIGLIWAVMLNDANKIKAMIEDMSEETNRTLFIGYLENMQKLYEPLQQGCDLYATQVANARK